MDEYTVYGMRILIQFDFFYNIKLKELHIKACLWNIAVQKVHQSLYSKLLRVT